MDNDSCTNNFSRIPHECDNKWVGKWVEKSGLDNKYLQVTQPLCEIWEKPYLQLSLSLTNFLVISKSPDKTEPESSWNAKPDCESSSATS